MAQAPSPFRQKVRAVCDSCLGRENAAKFSEQLEGAVAQAIGFEDDRLLQHLLGARRFRREVAIEDNVQHVELRDQRPMHDAPPKFVRAFDEARIRGSAERQIGDAKAVRQETLRQSEEVAARRVPA